MTPEQAWHTVKNQLQLEIPRAHFDTWVRAARYVSEQEGRITLAVPNAYGRDWLASRMTQTIQNYLDGCLAQNTTVEFVVDVENSSSAAEPVLPPDFPDEVEPKIDFVQTHESLQAAIIRPNQIVAVPGYFLRWLPFLGSAKAWIVVALRQAFFFCNNTKPSTGQHFEASGNQIARWAGMSRQTVHNHLKTLSGQEGLGAFIERAESENGQQNRFRFKAEMPLTPADAGRLRDWFVTQGGRSQPAEALDKALSLQPKQLIPYPAPATDSSARGSIPLTVGQVVLTACEVGPAHSDYATLLDQAEHLAARLMPPQDQLIITHYFLRHWLPLLGAGPAWMITLLRDQIYHNRETGELRDHVELRNGYRELAQALGISRPKTIGDWLPAMETMAHAKQESASDAWKKRQATRALVARFLDKTADRIDNSGWQKTRWTLKVRPDEPLVSEHQSGVQHLLQLSGEVIEIGGEAGLDDLLEGENSGEVEARFLQGRGANLTGQEPVEARSLQGRGANLTGQELVEARSLQVLRRDFDTLKHLTKHYKLKPILKAHYHAMVQFRKDANGGQKTDNAVVVDSWNIEKVLALGGVDKRRRKQIDKQIDQQPELGTRLLAWWMYGYANKSSESRKGIDSPALFAMKRFEERPEAVFMEMAVRTPQALFATLYNPYSREVSPAESEILNQLADSGFGDVLRSLTPEDDHGKKD